MKKNHRRMYVHESFFQEVEERCEQDDMSMIGITEQIAKQLKEKRNEKKNFWSGIKL